jgi:hypothetical protein
MIRLPKQLTMKKVFLIISTTLVLVSCSNDKKETSVAKNSDLTGQHLAGNVKTFEETSYTPDSTGKTGAMDSCCIESSQFDDKGYNTSTQSKDSKGNVKNETTISHYDGGQAKDIVTMSNGKKTSTFSIEINKDGKYSGAKIYDSAGKMTSYYTDLTEDDYGAVTSASEHKADSSAKSFFNAEYNKGLQVNSTGKDSSGKVTFTYKAELDDKGNISKTTTTSVTKDSTTTTVLTFKYDSFDTEGNWTQRTTYNDKGKATKVVKRAYTYYKKD